MICSVLITKINKMEYSKILDWVKSENIRGSELETYRCVADVIENFLNENKEAINYSRCCKTSSFDKEGTFENWYNKNGYIRTKCDPDFFYKENIRISKCECKKEWEKTI